MTPAAPDPAIVAAFTAAMDDDFGTPAAVAAVFDAVRGANAALDAGDTGLAAARLGAVEELLGALGFGPPGPRRGVTTTTRSTRWCADRDAARPARDFATADRIRDELARRGITIEDSASGSTWHR